MYYFYVYLILSENRIVILKNKMVDDDYFELMNCNGVNEYNLLSTCKMFCFGYMIGSKHKRKLVNNIYEFQ